MEKMIIYQVLPRIFGNREKTRRKNGSIAENGTGKFSAFTPNVLAEIRKSGFTHIWYTGVIEHATQTDYTAYGIARDHSAVVKGKAGSPYAVKDYYDVDPDLADHVPGRMMEFEALVRRTHDAGMKVIIDFVANHVARRYYSDAKPVTVRNLGEQDDVFKDFDPGNNFYYLPGQTLVLHFGAEQEDFEYSEFPARATGNDCFSPFPGRNDWYETIKLNYGVDCLRGGKCHFDPIPDTWLKMLDILRFWAGKGVDGFRCDMAEMAPVEFWNWAIQRVKAERDVCFIAEVYNPSLYRKYIREGLFDYLYDKVGLYDTLRDVICGRKRADEITRRRQEVEDIHPHMLAFLENHDEQRIASAFFAGYAQAGFPGMIVAATLGVNPVMLYYGQELGEPGMDDEGFSGCDGRTTIFDYWSLERLQNRFGDGRFDDSLLTEEQKALHRAYAQLLRIAGSEPAICRGAFFDLMYANAHNPCFNRQYIYACLRKYCSDVALIVVNFERTAQTVRVRIPPEAFTALRFADNRAAVLTDLFTGRQTVGTLTAACPFEVSVPAHSGMLLRFEYDSLEDDRPEPETRSALHDERPYLSSNFL
ncbi:MAG: alpha-amylase family protein [Tannerella sp.]|jgi:glycosidase|nr:alpha-amylase family protein [Tannerella sp.]